MSAVLRVALLAAIILALAVLVAGLTGCVTSPKAHPPITCTPYCGVCDSAGCSGSALPVEAP